MLSYPPRSAPALGFLRRSANDIDIYVEDASRADVWLALVKKCLPRNKRLRSVNPLGSRHDVLEACRLDQSDTRPRLYIVDGDFDFLLGRGVPRLNYLFRIPATNVEAFALKGRGHIDLLDAFCVAQNMEEVSAEFERDVSAPWHGVLRRLFCFYAENERLNAGAVTCGYHVQRLRVAGSTPWTPNMATITTRAKEVADHCRRAVGTSNQYVRIRRRAANLPIEKIASGKSYLWPLMEQYFRMKTGAVLSSVNLMLLVANAGGCPSESLRRRLRRLLN